MIEVKQPKRVPRPLTCNAVTLVIEGRLGFRPHRITVRRWTEQWLIAGEQYLRLPGKFLIYPEGIEIILEHLKQPE